MKDKTFRHSGKLGDIIYSLPAVKALGGGIFYVDHRTEYIETPPLGEQTALMVIRLLETQKYVKRASLYEGETIDYDLDRFRNWAIPLHVFNIIKSEAVEVAGKLFGAPVKDGWQMMMPAVEVDLAQLHWESVGLPGRVNLSTPWMTGIGKKSIAEIVVSKTTSRPGKLDWLTLRDYAARSVFVGFEDEWRAFCDDYFEIPHYRAMDLLDLAQVIAGAKLFVGNQSFGLALADAMLIPRVVQLWEASPNRLTSTNTHHVLTHDIVKTYLRL